MTKPGNVSTSRSMKRLQRLCAGLCAAGLLGAVPASAQAPQKPTAAARPAAAPGAAEEAAPASGPGHEGIKIHGHWVLEVHNPDGKLADRREFENALLDQGNGVNGSTGDQLIAGLLSGAITSGDPAVAFISTPTGTMAAGVDTSSLCVGVIANTTCDLFYTGSTGLLNPANKSGEGNTPLLPQTSTVQSGLTSTVNFGVYTPATWVPQGNYTFTVARDIAAVETRVSTCVSTANGGKVLYNGFNSQLVFQESTTGQTADLAPAKCLAGGTGTDETASIALTYTVITNGTTPTPLKVVAGQIVTVIVTLSFS